MDGRTNVQTKLEIEHASVGLAHARPIRATLPKGYKTYTRLVSHLESESFLTHTCCDSASLTSEVAWFLIFTGSHFFYIYEIVLLPI